MPSLVTQLRGHVSRTLCHPLVGRVLATLFRNRIPTHGRLIDTSNPHIAATTVARLFWGLYEAKEVRLIERWLPADCDVVELGASIGVAAAHIAHRLQPQRQLICVEANPDLLASLRANVAANSRGCALTVLNQAIDYSGQATVHLDTEEVTTNSRLGSGATGHTVPATTLSRIIADYGLHNCVVVADIEGAELGLLLSDQAGLRQVQQLIIELHQAETAGAVWSTAQMRDAFVAACGFVIREAAGPVYVFERRPAGEPRP